MKRDARLHGLSSDHHRALVFVRQIRQAYAKGQPGTEFNHDIANRLESQLIPHFDNEEQLLLTELKARGEPELAERTLLEHRLLKALLADVRAGRPDALESLANMLEAHIRFEERELFPWCEAVLPQHTLDAVARRAVKRI